MKNILVTGGAGYIGSHTVLSLLEQDYHVTVLDNLTNASFTSIRRVEAITGKHVSQVEGDVRDKEQLRKLFCESKIDAVIHFAALKAVGESSKIPLTYYENNVYGTLCLLQVMAEYDVHDFIFSSSATVYGEEAIPPYHERMQLGTPSSPYGASKVMVERVLQDTAISNAKFRGVSLRYFNPIGAHPSGKIGEDPSGIPNNLLPYIAQVAIGKRDQLSVFGDDYPTADGTCERDYLHVLDLAEGHVAALQWLKKEANFKGVEVFNLGTGKSVSVFAILRAFEKAYGQPISFEVAPRRAGDLPAFWANPEKANRILNWQAKYSLDAMMEDTWRWQSNNPDGYR